MKNRGFEVVARNGKGKVIIDRSVNDISDGRGWGESYAESGLNATFYVDGKPQITYHQKEVDRKRIDLNSF